MRKGKGKLRFPPLKICVCAYLTHLQTKCNFSDYYLPGEDFWDWEKAVSPTVDITCLQGPNLQGYGKDYQLDSIRHPSRNLNVGSLNQQMPQQLQQINNKVKWTLHVKKLMRHKYRKL